MMDDKFKGLVDKTRRQVADGRDTMPAAEGTEVEAVGSESYSVLSADRAQKAMCEFRLKTGNAVALAYSYLVKIDFDPSAGIEMDFSAHAVKITGKNLAAVFAGLVAQRVAVVTEIDELQAEAVLGKDATVVTGIEVVKVE
jgi:hypothetical protein